MKRKLTTYSLLLLALIVSACGTAQPAASGNGKLNSTAVTGTAQGIVPKTGAGTGTPLAPALINVSQNAKLGPILTDGQGMTVYILTQDTPNTSTCYGSCSAIWPPVLTDGAPTPGSGMQASLLGITTRNDGSTQVTYNSWPLYYFVNDKGPGDTDGEGVQDVWYVITPSGKQK